MSEAATRPGRRVTLDLRRPALHLIPAVRPTVVVDGLGQPAQWGVGTWLVPDDEAVEITIFLFNRLWRFGAAHAVLHPGDTGLSYRAPLVPLGPGRIVVTSD
jgi:hypothetical protein